MIAEGSSCSYLALTKAIRLQIKLLRIEPLHTVKRLLNRLTYFHGKEYRAPGSSVIKMTKEGGKVVQEAINVLKTCPPLIFDDKTQISLDLAAEDHAVYIGNAGIVSHTGKGKTSPSERVEQYAKWIQATGEVIWYGTINNSSDDVVKQAQEIIDDLVVDDGVPDRGHRSGNPGVIHQTPYKFTIINLFCTYLLSFMIALLDPRYLIAGVGIHKHAIYGNVVVVELAHDVDENESSMISCSNGTQSEVENEAELLLRAARSTRMKARIQNGIQMETLCLDDSGSAKKDDGDSETQWSKSIGVCNECGEDIRGGRVVELASNTKRATDQLRGRSKNTPLKWHHICFVCSLCKSQLSGNEFKFIPRTEQLQLACITCWNTSQAPLSDVCNDKITEMATIKEAMHTRNDEKNMNKKACHEKQKKMANVPRGLPVDRGGGERVVTKSVIIDKNNKMESKTKRKGGALGSMKALIDDYAELENL